MSLDKTVIVGTHYSLMDLMSQVGGFALFCYLIVYLLKGMTSVCCTSGVMTDVIEALFMVETKESKDIPSKIVPDGLETLEINDPLR